MGRKTSGIEAKTVTEKNINTHRNHNAEFKD